MLDIILIGAGGHAQSVLEVFQEPGQHYNVVGILDDQYKEIGVLMGIPLLGDISLAPKLFGDGIENAFLAIGSNIKRMRAAESLSTFRFPAIISKYALPGSTTHVGDGSIIMPGACLRVGVRIGKHCIVNTNASVDHESVLSDFVHVAPGCAISGRVTLSEGVFLGTGSSVIDKISIGEWSTVGAGGTVVKDLPDRVLAIGTPAKVCRTIN